MGTFFAALVLVAVIVLGFAVLRRLEARSGTLGSEAGSAPHAEESEERHARVLQDREQTAAPDDDHRT